MQSFYLSGAERDYKLPCHRDNRFSLNIGR